MPSCILDTCIFSDQIWLLKFPLQTPGQLEELYSLTLLTHPTLESYMLPIARRLTARRVVAGRTVRTYANSNEGRKGPLTGQQKQAHPNEGRKGPLTGQKSNKATSSSQNKSASQSQSTQGAESSDAPKTAPGQGVEDRGGHAMPSGPGKDGKFAEQDHSALEVSGAGAKAVGNEKEAGRDQKVDSKFWSDKK